MTEGGRPKQKRVRGGDGDRAGGDGSGEGGGGDDDGTGVGDGGRAIAPGRRTVSPCSPKKQPSSAAPFARTHRCSTTPPPVCRPRGRPWAFSPIKRSPI